VLPAFTTLDGVVSVPVAAHWTVVARGENLTDTTIITRNAGGSIDLGTPRRLWIGVRLGGPAR
jgi:iron complex outermembrane receptor protein